MRIEDISKLGPSAQRQIQAKLGIPPPVRTSKYNNVPTEVRMENGTAYKFSSKKEAARFQELCTLARAEVIRSLKLQPQFTLQESYVSPEGERVRAIRYVADFSYEVKKGENKWALVVEDVKSSPTKTQKYRIKRKLLREKFGIIIKEV